jgi:tetratricopeptide (TPR) repeat protein
MESAQVPERLQAAIALHRAGELQQAQTVYELILEAQPDNFNALNLLGVIAGQTKHPERALQLIDQAIGIDPNQAAAHNNRGLALKELRQPDAAVASFDRAIAIKPDYAEAHYNRGVVLAELGQPGAALASLDRAIALRAGYALAYARRGDLLSQTRQLDEALRNYDVAIALGGAGTELHFNRANVLLERDQPGAALSSYDQAIAIKPDYAEAYCNRGNALKHLGHLEAARSSYDRASAIKPDLAEAYCNRGVVEAELRQLDAARSSYSQAIAMKPGYAEAHSNLGNLFRELGQCEAALANYNRAIAFKADCAEAYLNRGILQVELRQLDAALADFNRAIAINGNYADAHYNRSIALLLTGDFANGWKDHEWRWKCGTVASFREKRAFPCPRWLGNEFPEGSSILLHAEQGLGDTLQFCRYAKMVSKLGARVVLEVQQPLLELLTALEGVSQVIVRGTTLPRLDYHCPLLSLPGAFNTGLASVPSAVRYLDSDASKVRYWKSKLGEPTKPRVGLAWSGNPNHTNDRNRSVLLSDLIRHLPPEIEYISLQKDVREPDRQTLGRYPGIVNHAGFLNDLSDTAALCECMDIVISVDTSVAHLSAALGKKTWILLPCIPDWRWLLDRDDSPWYPTARLYRQTNAGDWNSVFESIAAMLVETFRWK